MMNDNNLASIPSVPSIQDTGAIGVPDIFPNGFSLPLKETPTELLDIIARGFPNRTYRVSAPFPISYYSRVIVEVIGAPSGLSYTYGKIQYQDKKVKFNYSCKSPFVVAGSSSSYTMYVEYVWKKGEFSARTDLSFAYMHSNSIHRRYNIRFMVSRKTRGEKYSIEIPDNFLPIGYWKEGVPCVSCKYSYNKTVFKVPANSPNTVIQEIAPQFRFPLPTNFYLGSSITNLIDMIPDTRMDSAYDYALQAGVFPVQKQLTYRTCLGWST